MKKISLKNLNLKEVEQLSREQLKNVLGGYADTSTSSGGGGCPTGQAKCTIGSDDLGCKTPYMCCHLSGYPDSVCDQLS